jgi:cyclophilin family peptidyl-prolyl cis-trans isomerase
MKQSMIFFVGLTWLLQAFASPSGKGADSLENYPFHKNKSYSAVIHTAKGKIVCRLFPDKAPVSVAHFIQLADDHFYEGLTFHRVLPNFVAQAGEDPEKMESSSLDYSLPAEIGLLHEAGALAWARLPDALNPNKRSSSSQFYITLDKVPFLDGDYTVFGQTIEGMDVVKSLSRDDKIEKIEILVK